MKTSPSFRFAAAPACVFAAALARRMVELNQKFSAHDVTPAAPAPATARTATPTTA